MTSPQGAELACGLCYEEITVQGEIDSCNHRFCHPCIARWSEIENSCPFCKQRFSRLRRKRLAPRAVLLAGGGLGPDSELPGVYEDSQEVEERNQRVVFEDPAFQEWIEELSCMICGGGENDDLLLLCDGCDRACHTYCAGLAGIPEGEWFCEVCARQRPQQPRQPAARVAARSRGRRRPPPRVRQRIDDSDDDSDVLEEADASSSSLESSSEEQEDEEAAAGTARPARRRRIASPAAAAAAAAGGRRGGRSRGGGGANGRGLRGQASASLDDDLDGFVVPDDEEERLSSGPRPQNSRRRPLPSSRREASRGGSAASDREEEELDQLPLAARLQRIRELEGRLGPRGALAFNDAPTQAHRDVAALSACWEDLRKGTATFSDLRRPSSSSGGGGTTAAVPGQPQRRRLVRAGAVAAGGGGLGGAAAAGRPRAGDSGASSGGGAEVVDLLSSPGFSGPSPISRHAASPATSPAAEQLAWQALDAAQQEQQQATQQRQRRRRSGSGAGTLPAGADRDVTDDPDLALSLAAQIRQQITEARQRGARLAPRAQPQSQQQQQQQRRRLLPGSTTGASPHRTARDMQLMAAAARGSTPHSSGQGRGGGGQGSARRGFQIPRMQTLDGGSHTTPAIGASPHPQAQYRQQPQQVHQQGSTSQNPFIRFGLQPAAGSGGSASAAPLRQQHGGSGGVGGTLQYGQSQSRPRDLQQNSSEQGSGGRYVNRDGGSPKPVYRQPAAPHSLPRHQHTPQHQPVFLHPLTYQHPQPHPHQLSPLQQQHLPSPPHQQCSWPAGVHGSAQWQEGQPQQHHAQLSGAFDGAARASPGVQPVSIGNGSLAGIQERAMAAEATLPAAAAALQPAPGGGGTTPAPARAGEPPAATLPQQQPQPQQDLQQQAQQQQPLSKHDIVNQIKPLLKRCLAEGQLHRATYKQANKAAVGLLFQLQRPFTAAEAEQAVQQAVQQVLQEG